MNRFVALLVCLVVFPLAAWADPAGRAARLAFIEGEASVFADPGQGWQGARINATLTSENSVWTEPGARAEVRFGSTALRIGETTQLDILRLDDDAFRAHVARGTLAVRIQDFDKGESYTVTTPEARFMLRSGGRYRIDADLGRGESRLTVFTGNARLDAAGGYISVDAGRSVRVTGGERSRYEFEPAYSIAIDEWALARDQRLAEREAARYVPRQMTGWEDLDDYGVWRDEPEYGPVWFPTRVEAGWAPYRNGRWAWVRPWGWAWVDGSPWGYAPFHYGRWAYIGDRWGWYPGRYTTRPVWAPALVGWIGGPGWNISLSTGLADVVGWYPLSPYERYQPWYTANVVYVNQVNHIVIPPRRDHDRRNDRRDYRYDNRDRGATVVPREHFGSQRPVQNIRTPVAAEIVAAQPFASGSSVLPPRRERPASRGPADTARPTAAPRGPSSGEAARPRPSATPLATARGTPAGRPTVTAPAVPNFPATPSSRNARPLPAQSAPRAVERVAPAQARPAAKPAPAQDRPARGADRPVEKPSKPVERGQGG